MIGQRVGYIRVSSFDQNPERQLEDVDLDRTFDPTHEMTWSEYLAAVLIFSAVSAAALFALLCTQASLPLNPQHFPNLSPVLALNVAVSFMTTTDWQAYSGESTLSYLAQMAGLGWQNFTAAAIGLAVALATIRGFTRTGTKTMALDTGMRFAKLLMNWRPFSAGARYRVVI